MPTGACGINCEACGLFALRVCSSCGPGRSEEAKKKLGAQERLFGGTCPVLACAVARGVDYCSRDCKDFPCENFLAGPYPYSQGYLRMQERRRKERPPDRTPSGGEVVVPEEYWEELAARNRTVICRNAGAQEHPPDGILLPFLEEYLMVDPRGRRVLRQAHAHWEQVDDPLLELLCLVYLLNAGPSPVKGKLVGVKELRGARFFTSPHDLDMEPLVSRYGNDPAGFKAAAERLDGKPVELADAAYCLTAFPKIPLYYLLWVGDEEFRPRVTVLFDQTIEEHLAPDAIWGLVTRVTSMLLHGR
ncbi:MAG: DUF3786 domain-containing protein [Desulfobacteraceae bacterium]